MFWFGMGKTDAWIWLTKAKKILSDKSHNSNVVVLVYLTDTTNQSHMKANSTLMFTFLQEGLIVIQWRLTGEKTEFFCFWEKMSTCTGHYLQIDKEHCFNSWQWNKFITEVLKIKL